MKTLQFILFYYVVEVIELKKIIHLVVSDSALLLVYSNSKSLYSYQILMWDRLIYTPQELYPHAYIALNIGRKRIKVVTGSID